MLTVEVDVIVEIFIFADQEVSDTSSNDTAAGKNDV